MSTTTFTDFTVGSVGTDDNPVHIRVPDTQRAFCGIALGWIGGFIPTAEVTPAAWCKACEREWEQT